MVTGRLMVLKGKTLVPPNPTSSVFDGRSRFGKIIEDVSQAPIVH